MKFKIEWQDGCWPTITMTPESDVDKAVLREMEAGVYYKASPSFGGAYHFGASPDSVMLRRVDAIERAEESVEPKPGSNG
jgi:hypothetical protein